jgi:hypothetical protein
MKGSVRNLCVEHKADADVFWIACSGHEEYSVPEGVWDEQEVFDEEGEVE